MASADRQPDEHAETGHAVLAIGVRALDPVVRARTAYYDASFVSTDPEFIHAHITLLAPWLSEPTAADLETVAQIAASTSPAEVTLAEVREFPGGVIYLVPEPDTVFRALTDALTAAFPQCPPYAGEFPSPTPHLTLDHPAGGVTRADVEERMAPYLPVTFTAERLDLQWWANDDCHLIRSWQLGAGRN